MAHYTEIVVLLDRSGSMASIKTAMESGFNEFINGHKVNPSTRISLVQFDGENPYEEVYTAWPVTSVLQLKLDPRGSTPLCDALCRAIDKTGQRFANMREGDRPSNVLFVIITDGQENASRLNNRTDVKKRTQHQNEKYAWQFVYLGANQDAIAEAISFGMSAQNAITYDANIGSTKRAMHNLVSNSVRYTSTGDSGTLAWTDAQRKDVTDTNITSDTLTSTTV